MYDLYWTLMILINLNTTFFYYYICSPVISMDTSFKVPWANFLFFMWNIGMEVSHVKEHLSVFFFSLLNSGGRHLLCPESVAAPRSCWYIYIFLIPNALGLLSLSVDSLSCLRTWLLRVLPLFGGGGSFPRELRCTKWGYHSPAVSASLGAEPPRASASCLVHSDGLPHSAASPFLAHSCHPRFWAGISAALCRIPAGARWVLPLTTSHMTLGAEAMADIRVYRRGFLAWQTFAFLLGLPYTLMRAHW